jgi:hypothetical protein
VGFNFKSLFWLHIQLSSLILKFLFSIFFGINDSSGYSRSAPLSQALWAWEKEKRKKRGKRGKKFIIKSRLLLPNKPPQNA